jgi:ribosomal protein S18 acetylase RimI-like enzyme
MQLTLLPLSTDIHNSYNKVIYDIHSECFPENNHVLQNHIDMIINACKNSISKVVLNDKKEVIGYILFLIGYHYSEDGYSYLIDNKNIILFNIGFRKEYQNKKLGTSLLNQIINEEIKSVKNSNVKTVQLIVRQNNERAKRVYKKLGFVQTDILKNHFKNINIDGLLLQLIV